MAKRRTAKASRSRAGRRRSTPATATTAVVPRPIAGGDLRLAAFEQLVALHGGRISPSILVEAARDPDSPFHGHFEWRNEVAGDQYRLAQASQVIRQWKGSIIKIEQRTQLITIRPVRRAQSLPSERGGGRPSYETTESLMSDPARRAEMVATALSELEAYRRRYAELSELAAVWSAVDAAQRTAARRQRSRRRS